MPRDSFLGTIMYGEGKATLLSLTCGKTHFMNPSNALVARKLEVDQPK